MKNINQTKWKKMVSTNKILLVFYALIGLGIAPNALANVNDYLDKLTALSSGGDSLSAEILGKAYYLGFISFKTPNGRTQYFTLEKDPEKAFGYLKAAALKDNYDAAALAGILVMNGDGVQQNHAEAIKYFEAAYARNEQARYYLSHYYYQSTDLKIKQKGFDLVKSTEYLENPELLNMLAKYYENGVAVKQDKSLASSLKNQAQKIINEREEFISARIAALEDNAKRKAEYGVAHDSASSQHRALIAALSVMSVVATAAMVSNASNLSLPSSAAPAPRGLTTHQMVSYGIIK